MRPTLEHPATVADRLDAAADLLAAHGLYVDGDFWPDSTHQPWTPGLPLDTVAAFYAARGTLTYDAIIAAQAGGEQFPALLPEIGAFLHHLGIGGRHDDALHHFWRWQDSRRTVEVVAVLRECADQLRARGEVAA